ncbi:hypothetical protein [Streptomyces sp. NPDC020597]|uniref:hypothetical protein n=1 Tax=unclassified Streptomyces TaxID=2593676 RepID=UPI0037A90DCD
MTEQRTFTVAGLDLSLTASGIAYRDGSTSTVKTRQKDGDGRLAQIEEAVQIAVGGEHLGLGPAVELVAMEDIPQNSHAAKPISMVHGVVRNLLQKQGIPYVLITPATLKTYATGKGSGDKVPMAAAEGRGEIEQGQGWRLLERLAGEYLSGPNHVPSEPA